MPRTVVSANEYEAAAAAASNMDPTKRYPIPEPLAPTHHTTVNASALNVHAPVANFDGLINCQTVVCSVGVISPMYSPGAGNVW